MIIHPHPDPIAIEIFGLPVRWYALMYLAGFIIAWFIAKKISNRRAFADLRGVDIETIIFAAVLGVIVGGRLGYVLFYNPAYYFTHPLDILRVWTGGMSFHGGLLGVIVALWVFSGNLSRHAEMPHRIIFLRIIDLAAVMTPPGLGLGRLGNFINAELPGRVVTGDLPWAFSFGIPDYLPRHPSQLYQLFVEGILLTVLMLWLARRPRPAGTLAGAFIAAYGVGRFIVEFFREPDAHLGFLWFDLSMGQLLSVPMVLLGLTMVLYPRWKQKKLGTPPFAEHEFVLFPPKRGG